MTAQMVATGNGRDLPAAWEQKIDLIKQTVAVGATDAELQLFLYQARKTGLDPLARQIYCIKRGGKATIQTGIDGYRLIADRTGLCAGNDDPVFEGEQDGHPLLATVTVWKIVHGQRCGFTSTARWSEYRAEGPMWQRMPYLMLGKCAEALALRKAFPSELSGLYTDGEMGQAENEPGPAPLPARTVPTNAVQRERGVADRSSRRMDAEAVRPASAADEPDDDGAPHIADTVAAAREIETTPTARPDHAVLQGAPATDKQLQTIARMARAAGKTIETEGLSRQAASDIITGLVTEMGQPRPA